MFPSLATNNHRDVFLSGAESLREASLCRPLVSPHPKCSDLEHLLLSKNVRALSFAAIIKGALFKGIVIICGSIIKPQVLRMNARSVVSTGAIVQNTHALGDCAVVQQPARSVGENWASASLSFVDLSVAAAQASSPKPASMRARRFIHLGPKAFWKRERKPLRLKELFCNFVTHVRLGALVGYWPIQGAFSL